MAGGRDGEWNGVLAALSAQPAGLLCDVDGTLARIVAVPDDASVEPDMREALHALKSKLAVVCAVSGRAPEMAERIVGLTDILYIGNHGLEELSSGEIHPVPGAEEFRGQVSGVLKAARERITIPNVIFEDKRISGTVHYRNAPDTDSARTEILNALHPLVEGTGLAVREGRLVAEIRPANDPGKGGAAERVVDRYDLQGCVFVGDDVTDADAFRVLGDLRRSRGVRTVSVGVVGPESPQVVRDLSDITVEGVDGVLELLRWLDDKL